MIEVGDRVPELTIGPLTLIDLIRWAGYQENWLRIHYDREHAASVLGAGHAVQSGHHRTALVIRALTDWLGERGWIRSLSIRHLAPVYPGDLVVCGGRVRALRDAAPADGARRLIDVDVWAHAGGDRKASEGTAVLEVDG